MAKKITVGVDGSEIAHMAYQCAAYLRKPEDKIDVFHISTPGKDYLPYDLQPGYIKENYDNLLISSNTFCFLILYIVIFSICWVSSVGLVS